MAKGVSLRMNAVLTASAVAALMLASICGTGTAVASDRVVFAEWFGYVG
jgi:hypothetical protein